MSTKRFAGTARSLVFSLIAGYSAAVFSAGEDLAETSGGAKEVSPRSDVVLDKHVHVELEMLLYLHRSIQHPGAAAVPGQCGRSAVECANAPERPHAHG